ncbi:MAG: LysM peptidoglycan-binding domain-containing protein [Planctomycetota bacterium]|nr:LysM peptidoglycan-binding domain-containing protein [Planctomycetota bacterium]
MKMNALRWSFCILVLIAGIFAVSNGISPDGIPLPGSADDVMTSPVSLSWYSVDERSRQLLEEIPLAPALQDPSAKLQPSPVAPSPLGGDPQRSNVPQQTPTQQTPKQWTVRPGDSIWKIAAEVLGHGGRSGEIIALNRDIDPDRLKVGQIIRLPGNTETAPPPGREELVNTALIHEVEPGDTLASIARQYYGVEDWKPILEANRDQIAVPEVLKIGILLRVPDRVPDRNRNDRR